MTVSVAPCCYAQDRGLPFHSPDCEAGPPPIDGSHCGGCGVDMDDREGWTHCSGGGGECGDRCPTCGKHAHDGSNLVAVALGCPACGERDADNLALDEETVTCKCGNVYDVTEEAIAARAKEGA